MMFFRVFVNMKKTMLILGFGLVMTASSPLAGKLQVSPSWTVLGVTPGGSKTGSYTVVNMENYAQRIKVQAVDWKPYKKGNARKSIEDWLIFNQDEIILEPGENKEFVYQIRLDKDVKGEKIAQVFFQPERADSQGRGISGRLGVILFAVAEGTQIVKAGMGAILVKNFDSVPCLAVNVKNQGNVHLHIGGEVRLWDLGKLIWQKKLEDVSGILDGETRQIRIDFDQNLIKEGPIYHGEIQIQYGVVKSQMKLNKTIRIFSLNKVGQTLIVGPKICQGDCSPDKDEM